jgi:acyl-CoA synthetase (AMP-forming)/AMP-acid ligase II
MAQALLGRCQLPRDAVRWAFRRHAQKTALITPERSLSFAQLHDRVERVVDAFIASGLRQGDVVLCQLPDGLEFIETRLAALESGVVIMSLHANADSEQVWRAFTQVSPRLLLTGGKMALGSLPVGGDVKRVTLGESYEAWLANSPVTGRRVEFGANRIAALGMTSGTTGAPKLLATTHGALLTSLRLLVRHLDIASDTHDIGVTMSAIPLSGAGGGVLLPSLLSGACLVVPKTYALSDVLRAVETHRVERLFLTPSQLIDVLDLPPESLERLNVLRQVIYGTEYMPLPKLVEALQVFGPILQQGYGSAEVLPPVALLTPTDHRLAMVAGDKHALHSSGRVVPEVTVTIRDENGRPLPSGRNGRVWVDSPTRFATYWRAGEPPDLDGSVRGADHALCMGDVGYLDSLGRLHVMARESEVIRVDDDSVLYPRELEEHMHEHRAVKEVLVTKANDARGPVLRVDVAVRARYAGGTSASALSSALRDHLQRLKGLPPWPVEVVIHPRLERSFLGKLLRRSVASHGEQRLEPSASPGATV